MEDRKKNHRPWHGSLWPGDHDNLQVASEIARTFSYEMCKKMLCTREPMPLHYFASLFSHNRSHHENLCS